MHPEPHDIHVEVPDFIPDDVVAEFESETAAFVANSSATAHRPPGANRRRGLERLLPASQARNRVQRAHAALGLVVGYIGLLLCTAWWWSLASTTGETIWWGFAVTGATGTAAATLALVGWLANRVRPARDSDPSTLEPTAAVPPRSAD